MQRRLVPTNMQTSFQPGAIVFKPSLRLIKQVRVWTIGVKNGISKKIWRECVLQRAIALARVMKANMQGSYVIAFGELMDVFHQCTCQQARLTARVPVQA